MSQRHAAAGPVVGRAMPTILRAGTDPAGWAGALGRAATLQFGALLLPPGAVPAKLIEAATGLDVALLQDVTVDRVPAAALGAQERGAQGSGAQDGPWLRLPAATTDPRAPAGAAANAVAAIETEQQAESLGQWWGRHLTGPSGPGLPGARLLGLDALPAAHLSAFAAGLRQAAPGLLLFGWTPGVPWSALQALPPGAFDMVACSLPWWDGQAEWLWQELAMLARIAPVVADAVGDAGREALAAILAEGWMTDGATPATETLMAQRLEHLAGLPWSRLASPAGSPAIALLRTDAPDPRQSRRATLAVTSLAPGAGWPAELALMQAAAGPFERFAAGDVALAPGTRLAPAPGTLSLFTAQRREMPPPAPLARKPAETAAAAPRLAIEAPSPCVDGGRFPARVVVGQPVQVEADVIGDGHDVLAAALRWQAPGQEDWTEVPMRLLVNDRWTAAFPVERLGLHRYVIEAWKDTYGSYVHELEAKHKAGVPVALELKEGRLLLEEAAGRARKPVRAALTDILNRLGTADADAQRAILLHPDTRAAMERADPRTLSATTAPIPVQAERLGAAFASWYEIFPRSMSDDPARHGTFRDVVRHLPRIQRMGFDVLYFPPIHPIGRINRKGRNNTLTPGPEDVGSPYAIGAAEGGHEALHPELGTIEDFQHLRMEAAKHGIELAIDFAIQCSPDHPWLREHKEWFTWRPDGTIRYAENPPKKYEDIVNVDFYAPGAVPSLWIALANAVLYWAGQGVRVFRVDNPHTKPLPFWEWIIAEVQARYPDAVFLAEAFTRPKVMYRLAKVGFSQSYSYFTWRTTKQEFQDYLTELATTAPREFFRPHFFVNTPDINPVPLQTAPRQGFLVRTALATLLSGLWGLYCGFELCEATPIPGREEYMDSEKYQIRAWDWDRPGNIVAEIAQLNAVRRANPALQTHLGVTFLTTDSDQVLAFEKATPDRTNVVLAAICTDLYAPHAASIDVPFWRWPERPAVLEATDLLTGAVERWTEPRRFVPLSANQPYALWRLAPARSA